MIDMFHGAGGTEKHLAQLAMGLDKSRYRPLVLTFHLIDNHLIQLMRENGVQVIDFPVGRYYTPGALLKLVRLARLIRSHGVGIVQTFHFKSDTYGVLAARLAGVRHVVSSRRDLGDLKTGWHIFLNRRLNRLIGSFIVVADAVGRVLEEKERVPREKSTTIYNGVDIVRFHPPTESEVKNAREKMGIGPEDFVVGTVAWFRPEKNHRMLLEALGSLREIIPSMRLLWVGRVRPLAESLREEARLRGLAGRVIFAGAQEDVRECLQCCDVAALVPLKNEGFSNAVLEKMAMGLPVIVTDTGGNAEAILDGHNGFVIPPAGMSELADRLVELFRNTKLRRAMGSRSRERVESTFTLEAMVCRHEKYYETIAKIPRREIER